MPCYYTADEFLRVIFRAMVNQLWRVKARAYQRDHGSLLSDDTFGQEINITINKLLASSETLFSKFSMINANAIMFIQDMVVYIEFCTAIKVGDVGCIKEILKRITIMFQAGNHHNYGLELLCLSYNI